MTIAAQILYVYGILCFKASALCLLHRIFPGRRFHQVLWAIGVFVALYSIAHTLLVLLQCIPLSATWDPSIKGHCVSPIEGLEVLGAFNIATDFIILALPMRPLWRLHVSQSEKIQLSIMFALGGSCVLNSS